VRVVINKTKSYGTRTLVGNSLISFMAVFLCYSNGNGTRVCWNVSLNNTCNFITRKCSIMPYKTLIWRWMIVIHLEHRNRILGASNLKTIAKWKRLYYSIPSFDDVIMP
jgi:hypothetical protein